MATCTSVARSSASSTYTPADAVIGLFSAIASADQAYQASLANGTGSDQIDLIHRKTYSLAAATVAINLYDGSLLDPQGNACPFRRIKRIRIKIGSTTGTDTLTLGYSGVTANAWTAFLSNPGTITLRASTTSNNAWIEFVAPGSTAWIVDSTHKLWQFDPGASTFSITVEIDGTSA